MNVVKYLLQPYFYFCKCSTLFGLLIWLTFFSFVLFLRRSRNKEAGIDQNITQYILELYLWAALLTFLFHSVACVALSKYLFFGIPSAERLIWRWSTSNANCWLLKKFFLKQRLLLRKIFLQLVFDILLCDFSRSHVLQLICISVLWLLTLLEISDRFSMWNSFCCNMFEAFLACTAHSESPTRFQWDSDLGYFTTLHFFFLSHSTVDSPVS